jgi:hypothetical protein
LEKRNDGNTGHQTSAEFIEAFWLQNLNNFMQGKHSSNLTKVKYTMKRLPADENEKLQHK